MNYRLNAAMIGLLLVYHIDFTIIIGSLLIEYLINWKSLTTT